MTANCTCFSVYIQGEGITCVYVNVRVDARVKLTLWWRATSAAWRCCLACCRAAAWARMAASRSSPPSRHGPTGIWSSSCWKPAWRSCVTVKQKTQKQGQKRQYRHPPTSTVTTCQLWWHHILPDQEVTPCCFQAMVTVWFKVEREAKSKAVSRDGNESEDRWWGFLKTLKNKAEQAIKMNKGGGGGENKGAGEGRDALSMPTFPEKE